MDAPPQLLPFFLREATMPHSADPGVLLTELDAKQDKVLVELDRLNSRIERLLQDCAAEHAADAEAA